MCLRVRLDEEAKMDRKGYENRDDMREEFPAYLGGFRESSNIRKYRGKFQRCL